MTSHPPLHIHRPFIFVAHSNPTILIRTLNVKCGSESEVSLPLEFPERERCNDCEETNLKVHRLKGDLVPESAFPEFEDVTKLYLNNLGIRYLTPGAFQEQRVCKEIHLSSNQIGEIPVGVFSEVRNLKLLDLSYNNIKEINEYLLEDSEVFGITLNLSHNQIEFIEESLFNSVFYNVSSLDLSYNKIFEIDFNYVRDTISDFNIAHNNFSRLRGCFYKIRKLRLSHNQITTIADTCSNETLSLNYLDVSHNKISRLNFQTFREDVNFREVLLGFNLLGNISVGSFSNMKALEVLNLTNNQIHFMAPGSFENLENLRVLDLSNNNLKHLDFNVLHSLHLLTELYIENNIIEEIDHVQVLERFQRLQSIDLDNNNFSCNHLIDIIYYLEQKRVFIVHGSAKYIENVHGVACWQEKFSSRLPGKLDGKMIQSVTAELKDQSQGFYSGIFWVTFLILTLLLFALAFQIYIIYYKCEIMSLENVEMI